MVHNLGCYDVLCTPCLVVMVIYVFLVKGSVYGSLVARGSVPSVGCTAVLMFHGLLVLAFVKAQLTFVE